MLFVNHATVPILACQSHILFACSLRASCGSLIFFVIVGRLRHGWCSLSSTPIIAYCLMQSIGAIIIPMSFVLAVEHPLHYGWHTVNVYFESIIHWETELEYSNRFFLSSKILRGLPSEVLSKVLPRCFCPVCAVLGLALLT